jgi:predicted RNA polymerase sigma factor
MVAAHCALPLPAGSRVAWRWIRRLVDGVGEAGPSPEEALGRLVVCSTSTGTAAAFSLVSARQEKLSHPFFFRSVGRWVGTLPVERTTSRRCDGATATAAAASDTLLPRGGLFSDTVHREIVTNSAADGGC